MIRIGICDNDEQALKKLASMMKMVAGEYTVTYFTNGHDMIQAHKEEPFEIAFLDIEMPEIDGMELSRELHVIKADILVIFVSDYYEKVYQSFQYSPFRFLRKGTLEQELEEALTAALANVLEKTQVYEFKCDGFMRKLRVSSIAYVESNGHYTHIVTEEKTYSVRQSMSAMEKELESYDFVRSHNSYLVNAAWIFLVGDDNVQLTNGRQIPLSRGKKKAVKQYLGEYLGRH